MKIAVIGTGYVGLVTGVVLAEIGYKVTCIDIDIENINMLSEGKSPIFEPGLEDLIVKNLNLNKLKFTTELEIINKVDIIFIAVGTPEGHNGSADLTAINKVAEDIGLYLKKDSIVVIKSTVPIGTAEAVENIIVKASNNKYQIDVVSNPEFLREGHAIQDTFNGDRIVIGAENERVGNIVKQLFAPIKLPILMTDRRSAELIKYSSNAFLAMKISYINEMANLCEKVGANIEHISTGIGLDHRIGDSFLKAGIGYGGSCLPKDTHALLQIANEHNVPLRLVKATNEVNEYQREKFLHDILKTFNFNIENKKICLLGLSFKPNTDDMRHAPSLFYIKQFEELGANVKVFDPLVKSLPNCCETVEVAIKGASAVIIITEWEIFKTYDWSELVNLVEENNLFDGRNLFFDDMIVRKNWKYRCIGSNKIFK